MSFEMKHDKNKQLLIITAFGPLTFEEYTSIMETIINSDDYPANINTIWDLRKADFSPTDVNFWEKIVNYRSQFPQRTNCRSALIVTDDLQFGMSRMFEILSEGKPFNLKEGKS